MNEQQHCHHLIETISDYVDGELAPELCLELERHLSDCENCRIVVNTLRKTIDLYRVPSPEEALPADIRERLFYRLHLEDFLKTRSG